MNRWWSVLVVLVLAVAASASTRDGSALEADVTPVVVREICNCDVDKDCDAICGEGKGFCGIFLACPDPPYKHVGSCFCKSGTAPADT